MTTLFDGNVLVALVINTHEHHLRVKHWAEQFEGSFATCTVTQGTLLRLHMQFAEDRRAVAAWSVLKLLCSDPAHEFWSEDLDYREVATKQILGYRDVTDAWLAHLAQKHRGRVATLDLAFAARYPELVFLIPELAKAQRRQAE